METLRVSKQFWKYIPAIYLDENDSWTWKYFSVLLNCVHFCGPAMISIGGVLKLYFESDLLEKEETAFIFLQTICNPMVASNYFFYIFRKKNLHKLCEKYEKTVNKRLNSATARFYEEAEEKATFFSKWPFVLYVALYDGGFLGVTFIYLVKSWFQENLDVLTWPNMIHIKWVDFVLYVHVMKMFTSFAGCPTLHTDLMICTLIWLTASFKRYSLAATSPFKQWVCRCSSHFTTTSEHFVKIFVNWLIKSTLNWRRRWLASMICWLTQ